MTLEKSYEHKLSMLLKSTRGCFFVSYEGDEDACWEFLHNKSLQLGMIDKGEEPEREAVSIFWVGEKFRSSRRKKKGLCEEKVCEKKDFYDFVFSFLLTKKIVCEGEYLFEKEIMRIVGTLMQATGGERDYSIKDIFDQIMKVESREIFFEETGRVVEDVACDVVDRIPGWFFVVYNEYKRYKKEKGCFDGEDILLLLYRAIREDINLKKEFLSLLKNVLVFDFRRMSFLQYVLLREGFNTNSFYLFLTTKKGSGILSRSNFKKRISQDFPCSSFLELPSEKSFCYTFECANVFKKGIQPEKEKTEKKDNYFITFLCSNVDNREGQAIVLTIKRILKTEGKIPLNDFIIFIKDERKREFLVRSFEEGKLKVSAGEDKGVRILNINTVEKNIGKYVFISGLSSPVSTTGENNDSYTEDEIYFAMLSATKQLFMSYSLMGEVGGRVVPFVKSKFLEKIDSRFVNEDVLTINKLVLYKKDYSLYNKATTFSYSFAKRKTNNIKTGVDI